jgi:hypothetical protein
VSHRLRRLAGLIALATALATAGCGAAGADRAAIVDGEVITQTEVQAAAAQVNRMEPGLAEEDLTPTGTLTVLVQARFVLDYLADKGIVVSDSVARRDAAQRGIRNPGAATIVILRFVRALSLAREGGQLGEAESAEVVRRLQSAKVEVNPRYGAFDPRTAGIELEPPGWVTPADRPQ